MLYPLDLTGISPGNLVSGETQIIPNYSANGYSYIIPNYCPFYSSGLTIEYNDGINPARNLVEGVDYNLCLSFYEGTETLGLPLYGAIQLALTYCSGTATLQYQTLGGDFQINQPATIAALTNLVVDPMVDFWDTFSGDTAQLSYYYSGSFTDNQYPDTTLYTELNNVSTEITNETRTYTITILSSTGTCINNNVLATGTVSGGGTSGGSGGGGSSPPATTGTAIFGGGLNTNSATPVYTYISIYNYSNNTAVVSGGNLIYGSDDLAAAGNSTVGIFGGGNAYTSGIISFTSVYTYSTDTVAAGGNLSYTASQLTATGNSTVGVFGGGWFLNTFSTTSIYSYSSNSAVAGSNLNYAVNYLAATGNNAVGIFGGGQDANYNYYSATSIYTYSSNTSVVGGNLLYSIVSLVATGNSTVGIFGGGQDANYNYYSATSIYAYSSNTVLVGGNLIYPTTNYTIGSYSTVGASNSAAASNSTLGVFGGGVDSYYNYYSTTSIYTYGSNAVVNGGNLSYGVSDLAACGANPGVNS